MPDDINKKLFVELNNIIRAIDDLSYQFLDHPQSDSLCDWIEKLQQWVCRASEHDWQYDQCGYWQHQYCIQCGAAKYPDMAKQSCSELTVKMGEITEEDFIKQTK